MDGPVPHVNHSLLQQCILQRVRVVGEVTNIESGCVKLRTSDDVEVIVKTRPGPMQYGRFACFTGTWTEEGILEEESHVTLSDNTGKRLLSVSS